MNGKIFKSESSLLSIAILYLLSVYVMTELLANFHLLGTSLFWRVLCPSSFFNHSSSPSLIVGILGIDIFGNLGKTASGLEPFLGQLTRISLVQTFEGISCSLHIFFHRVSQLFLTITISSLCFLPNLFKKFV
jgi:hypothetical protein